MSVNVWGFKKKKRNSEIKQLQFRCEHSFTKVPLRTRTLPLLSLPVCYSGQTFIPFIFFFGEFRDKYKTQRPAGLSTPGFLKNIVVKDYSQLARFFIFFHSKLHITTNLRVQKVFIYAFFISLMLLKKYKVCQILHTLRTDLQEVTSKVVEDDFNSCHAIIPA